MIALKVCENLFMITIVGQGDILNFICNDTELGRQLDMLVKILQELPQLVCQEIYGKHMAEVKAAWEQSSEQFHQELDKNIAMRVSWYFNLLREDPLISVI